ncbi:C40 family peptidase [Pseudonocardia sp. ICBG601]|uniref:C40 family peptidase n=1 Tax=Pseudonocardia sp. ICBG601 TaxID=2846759 RepID=UPI0035ABB702
MSTIALAATLGLTTGEGAAATTLMSTTATAVTATPPDADTAQLASTVYACPDSGGAGLRTGGAGVVDATTLPPGFTAPTDPVARAAVTYALAQLGKPYVWGGTGPDGFDCSGLMLASWAAAGVALPGAPVRELSPAANESIIAGQRVYFR